MIRGATKTRRASPWEVSTGQSPTVSELSHSPSSSVVPPPPPPAPGGINHSAALQQPLTRGLAISLVIIWRYNAVDERTAAAAAVAAAQLTDHVRACVHRDPAAAAAFLALYSPCGRGPPPICLCSLDILLNATAHLMLPS